jgi:glycolate oxidase FAD binding subunit
LEHEPGDLTCIVEAGVPLSNLQAALGEQGQRLSLDPPGDPTLGECLLHDLSGPLRHRFGTMRDLVIGVTVTLLDGTRASSGGKVVKNVAGYDLGKLFCGSRGRLGSVERIALRLHPCPVAQRTVAVAADRWPRLHHSGLVPSAVDLVGDRMLVLFEGGEGAVHAQVTELGGDDVEPWAEVRALQADLHRQMRWDGGRAPLVRPGPRVAYVEGEPAETWSPLAERVVAALGRASCSPS